MTVNELIMFLQECLERGGNGDAKVLAFDGDSGQYEEVSGCLFNSESYELQTDEV